MQTSSQQTTNLRVRLVADLSAGAFHHKQTREMSLWYCLRAIDYPGSGIVSQSTAMETLERHFGFSRRTAQALLHKGDGELWQTANSKLGPIVILRGIFRLTGFLGVANLTSTYFREVPSYRFNTNVKRKAELFASVLATPGIDRNPISRAALREITGVPKTTQLRYEKIACITKETNIAVMRTETGVIPYKMWVEGKNRRYLVNEQLPNTYESSQQAGRRGILKRLARKVRCSETRDAQHFSRRYFSDGKKLLRAVSRAGPKDHHLLYLKVNRSSRHPFSGQGWEKVDE